MIPLTPRETPGALKRRLAIGIAVCILAFAALLGRLWQLQILEGQEQRMLSDNNRIRLHRVQATRGTVRDRDGRTLVDSRPSFDAVLVPEDATDLPTVVENLSQYLRQGSAETQALLVQAKGRPAFQEIVVKRDLTWDEVVAIETHQLDVPGVSLQITPRRSYPYGPMLAHLLGYVGEVNRREMERDDHYRMGDLIGKAGLERRWEKQLRGIDGGQQVEVDAVGRRLQVLREVEEVPGNTLTLTIDLDLQEAAEQALGDREGALVAIDPRNGEILAMVSHPSFDPNEFARGIRPAEWRRLMTDPLRPMNNRAIQGQYPPGSIYKIIMATAALEEGVINPFNHIHCGGGMQFGNRYFHCWKRGGHGSVDLHEALVQSCDTYFYQVGQRLGIESIAEWSRIFGLGTPSGVELENEKSGLVPDPEWKRKRFKQPWFPGETMSVSIGQGYVTVTPIQMADMIAAIATGRRYRPHFVKSIEAVDGGLVMETRSQEIGELPVRKSTLTQLRAALRDVVESDHGTGKKARLPGIEVGGKTGTAQVVKLGRSHLSGAQVPRKQRDHAWFVSFAPVDDPQIAVAALVEHAGGGGGAVAAPTAREVLSAFFHIQAAREGNRYAEVRSAADFAF